MLSYPERLLGARRVGRARVDSRTKNSYKRKGTARRQGLSSLQGVGPHPPPVFFGAWYWPGFSVLLWVVYSDCGTGVQGCTR